jgi:hypothetical protein
MTSTGFLLWQPSVPTERIVRALRDADHLTSDTVRFDQLAEWISTRRSWHVRIRTVLRAGRPRPVAFIALPDHLDRDLEERLHGQLDEVPGQRLLLRARPELAAQWLHRRHVLGGGTRDLDDYLADGALLASLRRSAETLDRLTTWCDAVVDVEHPDGESALFLEVLRRLGAPEPQAPFKLPGELPMSTRGVEILRRLNGYVESAAERELVRAFCQRTFRSATLAEATAMPDEQWAQLETALSRHAADGHAS